MKRRLYVVEAKYGAGWVINRSSTYVGGARSRARDLYELHNHRVSVRVVAYGPHGERVSARPLLVLKAGKQ